MILASCRVGDDFWDENNKTQVSVLDVSLSFSLWQSGGGSAKHFISVFLGVSVKKV